MKLVPKFGAPSGCRLVWHSEAIRSVWEPRISAINRVWEEGERRSVAEGVRDACQQLLTNEQYIDLIPWAIRNGLYTKVIRRVKRFQGFSHHYEPGNEMAVVVMGRLEGALEQPELHFGYPVCCTKAFDRTFPIILDQVWQWAEGGAETLPMLGEARHVRRVTPSPYTNPMLRYVNVRFVPHIPCRWNCQGSESLGKFIESVWTGIPGGFGAIEWIHELLSGPMTWDCYRGVAVVTTPLFRIVTGSTVAAERYIVEANQ